MQCFWRTERCKNDDKNSFHDVARPTEEKRDECEMKGPHEALSNCLHLHEI